MSKLYDVVIVGGGPAGLTCAIYSLRAGKSVVLLERKAIGGQTAIINNIENYPGMPNVNGFDLCNAMLDQAKSFGLELVYGDVVGFNLSGDVKLIKTSKHTLQGKTVVLAMGAKVRELDLDNEKKFLGRGVSYCATCDGAFFRDGTVAVVGGGNTALHDALYLSQICKTVYLIHRRDEFRAEEASVNALKDVSTQNPHKVKFLMSSRVVSINGDDKLKTIDVQNNKTGQIEKLPIDGLFVAVGRSPDTDMLTGITLDNAGYIQTDDEMKTNIDGVFAAGDVRHCPLRQIVCACSDGAIASLSAVKYLGKK